MGVKLRYLRENKVMPSSEIHFTSDETYIISKDTVDTSINNPEMIPIKDIGGRKTFYILDDGEGTNGVAMGEAIYTIRTSDSTSYQSEDILKTRNGKTEKISLDKLIKNSEIVPKWYKAQPSYLYSESKTLYLDTLGMYNEYILALNDSEIINFIKVFDNKPEYQINVPSNISGRDSLFLAKDENIYHKYKDGKLIEAKVVDRKMFDSRDEEAEEMFKSFLKNDDDDEKEIFGKEYSPYKKENFILCAFTDGEDIYSILEKGDILYTGKDITRKIASIDLDDNDWVNVTSDNYGLIHLRDEIFVFRNGIFLGKDIIDIQSTEETYLKLKDNTLFVIDNERILEYELSKN